jgi:hypothetical protein
MAAGNQDGLGFGPTALSVCRPVRRFWLADGVLTRRDAAAAAVAGRLRLSRLRLFGVMLRYAKSSVTWPGEGVSPLSCLQGRLARTNWE